MVAYSMGVSWDNQFSGSEAIGSVSLEIQFPPMWKAACSDLRLRTPFQSKDMVTYLVPGPGSR